MLKNRNYSGFSLVELMTTIAVVGVVMVGVIATFSRINSSTKNASRGLDITNSTQGIQELLKHDFGKAGKGISDLAALNFHYKFSPSFVQETTPSPFLYGVADLDYDSMSGSSEVTLQWFDYSLSAANEGRNPTFLMAFDTGESWDATGLYTGPVHILSNNSTYLNEIESGDIFVFYRYQIFTEASEFAEGAAIWNSNVVDEAGNPVNSAVVLQIGTVTSPIDVAQPAEHGIDLDFQVTATLAPSTFFDNDLSANPVVTPYVKMSRTFPSALIDENDGALRFPASAYLARKLGNSSGFHRVHYRVEDSSQGEKILVRNENGRREIVATGVTKFEVYIGIDTANGMQPDAIQNTDIDGYVSSMSRPSWTRGLSDPDNGWGVSEEEFKIILGRHAMAAEVHFTQQSTFRDSADQDTGGEGNRKIRSFVQQFRIWNNGLPMPNL